MKKYFAFFFTFLMAALPAFAASTCETRVDSHQNATTRERVAYCLTPETVVAEKKAEPELVYYGVSDKNPAPQTKEAAAREQVYFDKDGVAVSQDYVGTKKFPTFANDTLSEQERWALEEARKKADAERAKLEATKEAPKRIMAAEKEAASADPSKLLTPSVLEEENKSYALRQKRPQRFMKKAAVPAQQPATTAPAASAQPANPLAADPLGVMPPAPTDTPPSEIQQAYALENDPLAQPSAAAANASSANAEGFLDDSFLMDGPSFGYQDPEPIPQP